jgi:hypothetical protein
LDNSVCEITYSNIEGGWEGEGNIDEDPLFADSLDYFLSDQSPCIDTGDPDSVFYDLEDPDNPGYALLPSLGTIRNDMGAYGGPGAPGWIPNSVKENQPSEPLPFDFILYPVYPNPFNSISIIRFSVRSQVNVSLKIYDLIGREVKKLTDGSYSAGKHKLLFDAGNLASGMYFVQMETETGSKTRKILLLK